MNNHSCYEEWHDNVIVGVEAIVLLDLIKVLERRGLYVTHGKVSVGFNNRIMHRRIISSIAKASMFVQDSGAEIAQTQSLIKKIKFEVELSLVKGYERITTPCSRVLLKHLIKKCNVMAKNYRTSICRQEGTHDMRFLGICALIKNDVVTNRSMKEATRVIDAKDVEYYYVKKKFRCKVNFVNVLAREAFQTKVVLASMIKCASGFNYYRVRSELINNRIVRMSKVQRIRNMGSYDPMF